MEEQLTSLAVTHLLQHTLRSFCIHENSQWVYAVFWRILPRNYPPPKWDTQGGAYERSRGNRRNWILVWEDGFCNFAASTAAAAVAAADSPEECPSSTVQVDLVDQYHQQQYYQAAAGLQPEVFFKMSHEIYNYGEGLIGKVAADHSHKWIYNEATNQEINFLSAWQNSADSHPRTWEAQFQSGIKTIALIAVREGVIQLGAVHKVVEDLSYVVLLRKKFSYIESIPGVLLPHPSSSAYPNFKIDEYGVGGGGAPPESWPYGNIPPPPPPPPHYMDYYDNYNQIPMKITPSMSSLEALLSKLPSVVVPAAPAATSPPAPTSSAYCEGTAQPQQHYNRLEKKGAKEELDEEEKDYCDDDDHHDHDHDHENNNKINQCHNKEDVGGETSSSISSFQNQLFGFHHNIHPSDTSMHNHGPYT